MSAEYCGSGLKAAPGAQLVLLLAQMEKAEPDELGPTLCWRGVANSTFYALEKDKRRYRNFAGTGNSINL